MDHYSYVQGGMHPAALYKEVWEEQKKQGDLGRGGAGYCVVGGETWSQLKKC